jgi:hypothetical protein
VTQKRGRRTGKEDRGRRIEDRGEMLGRKERGRRTGNGGQGTKDWD